VNAITVGVRLRGVANVFAGVDETIVIDLDGDTSNTLADRLADAVAVLVSNAFNAGIRLRVLAKMGPGDSEKIESWMPRSVLPGDPRGEMESELKYCGSAVVRAFTEIKDAIADDAEQLAQAARDRAAKPKEIAQHVVDEQPTEAQLAFAAKARERRAYLAKVNAETDASSDRTIARREARS
jgi:hypothetical protein